MHTDDHDGASRRQFLAALGAAGATSFLTGGDLLAQTAAPTATAPKPAHIDVHHHFYPPEFLKAVNDFSGGGQPPAVAAWTPQKSLEQMDMNNVTTAIVSLWSIPGVWMGNNAEGMRKWARFVNDYGAKMVRDHPGRFGLFAALPLPDVEGSLKEIEYVFDTLKADGVGLMTNFGNKWPGDPTYKPVFEELNRRKAVVYFHPVAAACCGGNFLPGVGESWMEVPYDTGRAVLSLLASGTFTRLRDIKWVFSHSGGTVPILAERVKVLSQFDPRFKQNVPNGVDAELQRLYYETANGYHAPNMAALLKYVPVSQVMFGTDYPYLTVTQNAEGLPKNVKGAALKAIQSGNAYKMFPKYAPKKMPAAKKT
jgi:predicted TIM-barrel fold metal-dependent hydrolase